MTTIYIAHTFELRHEVKNNIQPKLEQLGFKVYNPFYNEKRVEVELADKLEEKGLNPREVKEWIYKVKNRNKEIVIEDLRLINKSDIIVAVMNEYSAGTICEIAYHGIFKEKPVYILTDNERIINHPWMNYATRKGKIIKDINELIEILKRRYR